MNEEMNRMNPEENDDIIELVDENGETQEFEWLASFPMNDRQYIAVAEPMEEDEPESVEVLFLRIEEDENGEDVYVPVDDEAEADAAYACFLKQIEAEEEEE